MKKAVFILVADNDLSAFSDLIGQIKGLSRTKNLYKASDLLGFIETIKTVEESVDSVFDTEIRVIIDLDLPFFEAYVCLQALAAYEYKCSVCVYLLEGDCTIQPGPNIEQYSIAGRFHKPPGQEELSYMLADQSTAYFQKNTFNLSDNSLHTLSKV